MSYLFYGCSSLPFLPNISKWNIENCQNLNSIFENCSSLVFIPDISKWKLNDKAEKNNIFRGCNSLLIIPDISKWNIRFNDDSSISSINYKFNKANITDSLSFEEIIKDYNLSENLFSLESNNNNFENNDNLDYSRNKDLNDYYDNFYN